MKYQTLFTVHARRVSVAMVGALIAGLGACSSSDGGTAGLAEGVACYMRDTSLSCHAGATLCYAVGTSSPCAQGGLCIGDGTGMVCAHRCNKDTDCAIASATAVCMQGCKGDMINGYCVEPAARDELLSTTCSTWSPGITGSDGVYN